MNDMSWPNTPHQHQPTCNLPSKDLGSSFRVIDRVGAQSAILTADENGDTQLIVAPREPFNNEADAKAFYQAAREIFECVGLRLVDPLKEGFDAAKKADLVFYFRESKLFICSTKGNQLTKVLTFAAKLFNECDRGDFRNNAPQLIDQLRVLAVQAKQPAMV